MKLAVDPAPNRAGLQELMSEAYSFAASLRDLRDYPGDSSRVGVAYAVHRCQGLLKELERAHEALTGGRHVPTMKELWEEKKRKDNQVSEADKEAFAELVSVMEKHIPRLSPKWAGSFKRSRDSLSEKVAEASNDASGLHLVNGGK